MRPTAPIDVSRRFFEEVWNNRQLDVIDELFTESSITNQLRSAPEPVAAAPRRPSDLKREITAWFESFPDIRFEIEHAVEAGDEVVTQCIAVGTHDGTWMGIAPTHRRVVIRMVLRQRIVGGRIVEDWLVADWHGFFAQLGVLPPLESLVRG